MKKVLTLIMALLLCFALAACSAQPAPAEEKAEEPAKEAVEEKAEEPAEEEKAEEPAEEEATEEAPVEETVEGPALPDAEPELESIMVYVDGEALNEAGYAYADVKDAMTHKDVNGTFYYGLTLDKLTGEDLADVKGVFFESSDGFISYGPIEKAFVAIYSTDDSGEYAAVENGWGGLVEGAMFSSGVNKVYLTTVAADWSVDIQVDGESVGALTMADFMKKTPMGDKKAPTALYDGSFMYAGGSSTYEGKFLGFGAEQMIAKLGALKMEIPAEYTEIEFYGNAMGADGKNAEYSTDAEDEKYCGAVQFFAMYDGKTFNDIANSNVGLTAFINGSGLRWMTSSLTAINFVTK